MVIIFEATVADFANYKTDLGSAADNAGTIVHEDIFGGACPEYWYAYNLENFEVHNSFSSGKKMSIAARFSTWSTCPEVSTSSSNKKSNNRKKKLVKGKKNDIEGLQTPTKHFFSKTLWWDYTFGTTNYPVSSRIQGTPDEELKTWGMVFERDWFSLKKKYEITCSTDKQMLKGRMRKDEELYASFYFTGDWCSRKIVRFKNRPGVGDQSSFIEIGSSTTWNVSTTYTKI